MINFNELPNEIKEIIFKKNRSWTSNQINRNKEKFEMVIDELRGMVENTIYSYYNEEDEFNIIDYDWGFGNALIECINDINLDNKLDNQMEDMIDNYYQLNE
jgi:hypothetical protein